MPVQMPGQTGSGGLSLVEPNIVTLGLKHPVENRGHFPDRLDRLEQARRH